MLHLLGIIEVILPLNPEDWERVKEEHDKTYASKNRSVNALIGRFQTLHRTVEPTGDPNIPEEVRIAKTLRNMILEKTDGTTGSFHPSELFGEEEEDVSVPFDGAEDDSIEEGLGGTVITNVAAGVPTTINTPRASTAVGSRTSSGGSTCAAGANGAHSSTAPAVTASASAARRGGTSLVSSSSGRRTPTVSTLAVSSRFGNHMQGIRSQRYNNKKEDNDDSFSFKNMMAMMMMQQNIDREEGRPKQSRHVRIGRPKWNRCRSL